MVDKPSRPILRLKLTPKPPLPPEPKVKQWRCKPCGALIDTPMTLDDDESVRCPSCNARLGLAKDFRGDDPNTAKVRARPIITA